MLRLTRHLDYLIGLKKVMAKIRIGAAFWKQPLHNRLFKMLYLKVHPYC